MHDMRRVWRWGFRLLILLIVLAIALAITVQVVLGTGLPRRLVISKLESALALRFGASSVHTGWGGRTELADVTVALPLGSNAFFKVKAIKVRHTNLLGMALSRSVTVKVIELDQPELVVQQDDAGQWNVLQAAQLIERAVGGKQAAQTAEPNKPEVAQIPQVILKDGVVRVIDRTGKTATVQPLNVEGKPDGPLVWRYDATAGPVDSPQLHVVGKLVPGGDWQHEVSLALHGEEEWIKPWLASDAARQLINQSTVNVDWRGRATGNGVSGLLELKDVHAAEYKATGPVNVDVQGSVVTARPAQLLVEGVPSLPAGVTLRGGEARFDGATLQLHDLLATAATGDVRLNGRYALKDNAATVTADWNAVQLPTGYTQTGSLKLDFREDWTGLLQASAQITSTAFSKAASWDAVVSLNGSGNTFRAIEWDVTAKKLRVKQGAIDADLDDLTAKLTNTPTDLTLASLSVPAGQLTPDRPRGTLRGSGRYRWPDPASTKGDDWFVSISGEKWPIFDKREVTASFNLDASGDLNAPHADPARGEWARLNEFYAETSNGIRTWAGGKVSYRAVGKPAELWVYMWYPQFALRGYTEANALQGGEFANQLHVTGGIDPPFLTLDGSLQGTSVLVGSRPVGDVSMTLHGDMRGKDYRDYTIDLKTQHLSLFEGDWDLAAHYASKTGDALVDVKLEQMSATALAQFVKNPAPVGGTVSGQWSVALPDLQLQRSTVEGDFTVANPRAPYFAADSITGHLSTNPRNILVNRIRVLRKLGGQIDGSLSFAVAHPTQLKATLNAAAWPLQLPGASLLIYAQTPRESPATIDLTRGNVWGPFKLDVYPILHGVDCGVVHTAGDLEGHRVSLTQINAEGFGGKITGVASYDLDNQLSARADLKWENLDSTQLSAFWTAPTPTTVPTTTGPVNEPGELFGRLSGSARLGAPTGARPLAPLLLQIDAKGQNLVWRTTVVDGAALNVYYDPSSENGEERLIMDRSVLRFAGGSANVFARLTRHPLEAAAIPDSRRPATQPTSTWAFNVAVDANNLDLNQLAHTGDKGAKDQPGKVQLHTTLLGNPADRRTWVGDGTARLTESDLEDNTIMSGLYAIMSVKFGHKEPVGRGSASFHFEGEDLRIDSFFFTQRGIEARGNGTVRSIWTVPDSPIDAFVAGTLRPLKDLKLPFAADLDRVVSLLQRSLTVIQVRGTVREPKISQKTFADIGQGLKTFILGDLFGTNSGE